MRIDKFRPMLQTMREKHATRGERVLTSFFPNRGYGFGSGASWTADRIEQVQHLKNWTYVAIDAIASVIAQVVPNIAYVRHQSIPGRTVKAMHFGKPTQLHMGGQQLWTNYYYGSKALSVVKPHEELEPLPQDHRLSELFRNPNAVDTSFDLLYELDMFMELCGVGYLWAVPNQWGVPCELWVIPSHWVWPRTGGGRYVNYETENSERLIEYYEIRPWGTMGSAGALKFPAEEVLMFNWKSPINKIDGYSKLFATAQWIDTEESIGKSRWAQFNNQAMPNLAIELPEGFEDPNDDRIARIEAKFMAKYVGEFATAKPFIGPTGVKITPLSFSPENMMYHQSEEQIRDMILSTFRVPKTAVGLSDSMTYGSILASLAQFATFCVNPRLAMLGLKLSKLLAPRFAEAGEQIRIWWDDCTPPDPAQVNSDIDTDYRCQAISPNMILAIRGRQPWKHGGDDPMVQGPGGVVPLPLNTGDDLGDLAELMEPMIAMENEKPEAEPGVPGQDAAEQFGASPGIKEPNGAPSKSIAAWDQWFKTVGGEEERAWQVIKSTLPAKAWGNWASMVELNRLDSIQKEVVTYYSQDGHGSSRIEMTDGVVTYSDSEWCVVGQKPNMDFIRRAGWKKPKTPRPQVGPRGELPGQRFRSYVAKTDGPHKFSSTQFNLPDDLANKVLEYAKTHIDPEDLDGDGMETGPHITVRYGLHTKNPSDVAELVRGFGPVLIKWGGLSVFKAKENYFQRGGGDCDVLILEVQDGRINELNALLGQLPNTSNYPQYKPHVTLAYLKPGAGNKYLAKLEGGHPLEGLDWTATELRFSNPANEGTVIDLAGAEKKVAKSDNYFARNNNREVEKLNPQFTEAYTERRGNRYFVVRIQDGSDLAGPYNSDAEAIAWAQQARYRVVGHKGLTNRLGKLLKAHKNGRAGKAAVE